MISVGLPNVLKASLGFIVMVMMDALWLPFATYMEFYPKLDDTNIIFAILAWISIATLISCGHVSNGKDAALFGMYVGLIASSTWNFTEAAVRKDWRNTAILFDFTYGTLLCTFTGFVTYNLDALV